ncbi:DUF2062 domain-containing protein [Desulfobaculum bizertense]|uniref:DUF2062 domain-containing protein n=1 Tax=Desulfobaculum bizertense DSM 18034 TaxID=1121442 RepID=A0A1T4W1D6_9BACT|nr:DUF2062 domain-containing protein [Desulfobaculum bizertense]UIJ38916.1 DUF2062 domain-containing protein [Desulfobaculum bizertense]SKA71053.1 hypothetical protein SAMN02745702_01400 [Desulfobaculum bizertense DSM 18034]
MKKDRFSQWGRFQRWSRYHFLRIMRLAATPHSIAMGCALGIFVGFMPIVPFQTVVVLALAFLFKGNKIAAMAGTWISNPVDLPFFYYGLYLVGKALLPFDGPAFDPSNLEMTHLIEAGWELFAMMVTGGIVLGIPAAILTYFVTKKLVVVYRKRRALRMLKRRSTYAR